MCKRRNTRERGVQFLENEILVIGGDLNGHVGKDRNSFEDVMGIDGYGERNADG